VSGGVAALEPAAAAEPGRDAGRGTDPAPRFSVEIMVRRGGRAPAGAERAADDRRFRPAAGSGGGRPRNRAGAVAAGGGGPALGTTGAAVRDGDGGALCLLDGLGSGVGEAGGDRAVPGLAGGV